MMKKIGLILGCLLTGCITHAAPVDYLYAPGIPATQARMQWQKLTEGEELARGKKVLFSPPPNYRLTTDENDPYDLTDGTLSSRQDDRVWFNKDAAGWYYGVGTTSGVLMMIDLGSVQPVGQIAIRVLGGREQGGLILPGECEFLASADGKQYYSLQKMVELSEAEKNQADNKTSFYIPEEGKAFMAPFVCRVPVMARYISLRVTPINSLFVDQISVLKATGSQKITELTSYPKVQVFTDGLALLPRHEPFVVTTNIATPNWLTVLDNTNLDPAKNHLSFRLELPEGLRVLPISEPKFHEIPPTHSGMHAYDFPYNRKNSNGSIGPLWIIKDANAQISPDAKVLLTGVVNGKDSHQLEYPVKLMTIPQTAPIKGLDISLAWMGDSVERQWPHFLRDFRKMGFNYVSTFPRNFGKSKNGHWNADAQKNLAFLKTARAQGYGIIYNESPFHVMWSNIKAAQKAGKIDDAEALKIYNQVDGKRGKWMNILYRGTYFQNEIKRVAGLAALVQPDQAYLDIEWWTQSVNESKKDPRVQTAWKASGKSWDDFMTDIGTEVLGDLVSAMRKAVPDRKMTVGLYGAYPAKTTNSIFEWEKIYPGIIDIAMPSLYIQGRPLIVSDRIRFDYDQMQTKQIIPWLSTGTYGEYDPKFTEPMVLESILNGSRGVTYFQFSDFDPMDFYSHAKAIHELAPYGKLLQNGKPVEYKGDNPALHYTAFASTEEALVLVGNYNHSPRTKVLLPLPFKTATKVLLGGKSLTVKNGSVSIDVPAGEFRLLHFGK